MRKTNTFVHDAILCLKMSVHNVFYSFHFILSFSRTQQSEYVDVNNPYFAGPLKARAAKKNSKMSQNSMGWRLADLLNAQLEP